MTQEPEPPEIPGRFRVYGILDPRGMDRETLVELQANARVLGGAAEGGLVLWLERSPGHGLRLIGWHEDWGGTRVMDVQLPGQTCGISLSPTHLVGFEGACDMPDRGRVWHVAREGDGFAEEIETGPWLRTEGIVFGHIHAWGDHAVVRAGRRILVRLSDGKTRWIAELDGDLKPQAQTLTEESLYQSYTRTGELRVEPYTLKGLKLVEAFHRYDLSKFDKIGLPECGTEEGTCWISPYGPWGD